MSLFMHWVESEVCNDRSHTIRHLVLQEQDTQAGINSLAELIPQAYVDQDLASEILQDFGKEKSAQYLKEKLPTEAKIRSGDIGEVVGANFASSLLKYHVINKLRWKDHPNMAMRGDDFIGVRESVTGEIELLKGEAKSRKTMTTRTIEEAGEGLEKDDGRPSPHSLSFVAERLREQKYDTLSKRIIKAQLFNTFEDRHSAQLLFTFSGNNSMNLLKTHTAKYQGQIKRIAVCMQVPAHKLFVRNVYEKVIEDA